MRRSSALLDGWTLVLDGELPVAGDHPPQIEAIVPGCVHVDLLAAGLIADPYLGRNELDQYWIGERSWTYRLQFVTTAAAPGEHVDLVFDGIDGVATITLNGVELGSTANQHRTYRFDAARVVAEGSNDLVVRFDSPVAYALSERERLGDLPNPYGEPYNFIRKMACNFGWDWGPRLTTSGLWKPVALERWEGARLRTVRPSSRVSSPTPAPGEIGRVDVVVEVEPGRDRQGQDHPRNDLVLSVALRSPSGDIVADASMAATTNGPLSISVDAPDVLRWWPARRGDQSLYRVATVLSSGGVELDRVERVIGFRDIRLDTTARPDGNAFEFWVNGERTWVRGVNWIPLDCFPARVTHELLSERLDQALDANANLVRIWGGGVYESDEFYERCDQRGLLVWQDFPFACAAYPETSLHDEVAAEASDNVSRLMSHPSLAVWCGNNECLEGWWDWGWSGAIGERAWGDGFYHSLLPTVVAELDPGRPYIDASPTSLDPAIHPQDPTRGTVHLWDVWNEFDFEHYRTHRPRFVAEFGFQAPPSVATLEAAVPTRPLTIDDPLLAHRQRAIDGQGKLGRAIERHFGDVTEFDDWLFAAQLNQANAIAVGVGHFRTLHERCSGVVWWQLADCWPSISWAVVDREGRLKPGWYALRRSFADRLAVLDPMGDGLVLALVNDGASAWRADVVLQRVSPDGTIVAFAEIGATVAPGTADRVVVPAAIASIQPTSQGDVVVATIGAHRVTHDAVVEKDRRMVPPRWAIDVSFEPKRVIIDVHAHTVVRDLCVFADRVDPDAVVDDHVVTMLPGESRRFTVTTALEPDAEAWTNALTPPDGRSLVLRATGDRW